MKLFYVPFYLIAGYALFISLRQIITALLCTQAVKGFYLETEKAVGIHNKNLKKAKFFYEFDGTEYFTKTCIGIPHKQWNAFRKGQPHTLYVNPKKPQMIVLSRKTAFLHNAFPFLAGIALLPVHLWFFPLCDFLFTILR